MSLDVSLIVEKPIKVFNGTGIFVREEGRTRELSVEEAAKRYPDSKIQISDGIETNEVFDWNITHNLGKMAHEAGLYVALWRPEEVGWERGEDLIPVLTAGLEVLRERSDHLKGFNPENGWGTYESLVEFVENYLKACIAYPGARIEVSR